MPLAQLWSNSVIVSSVNKTSMIEFNYEKNKNEINFLRWKLFKLNISLHLNLKITKSLPRNPFIEGFSIVPTICLFYFIFWNFLWQNCSTLGPHCFALLVIINWSIHENNEVFLLNWNSIWMKILNDITCKLNWIWIPIKLNSTEMRRDAYWWKTYWKSIQTIG
jgi:hypothetical protein